MNKRNWKRVLAVFMSVVMIVTGIKLTNRTTHADPYTTGHNAGDTHDYIEQSYYELDEYNENDILGAAQRFLLFGRESVAVGVHTNGNLASPILITKNNGTFTVNGMPNQTVPNGNYRLINYFGELQTENSGSLGLHGDGYLLIIGQSGDYVTAPPRKINGKEVQGNWNAILYANPNKEFLDFDKEFAHLERLSQAISSFTGDHSKTVSDIHEGQAAGSGQNHIVVAEDGVTVLSLTGAELASIGKDMLIDRVQSGGTMTFESKEYKLASSSQVMVINVDLSGYSSYNFDHEVKYCFTDGTVVENNETTIFNGNNILWNFYDSSSSDGLYHGTLSFVDNHMVGTVLAPAATVRAHAVNGTVIGKNVESYGAEVHRSDFRPTSIPGLKMYKITYDPNASDATLGTNDTAVTDSTVYEYNELATILNNNDQTTPGNWRRDGYSFVGWSEDPSATTPSYVAGETIKMNSDKTLYAIWKPVYTVTYHENLASASAAPVDSLNPYESGETVTVLGQGTMAAEGYTFHGWNTNQEAASNGSVQYTEGNTFSITQNTDLYAVWAEIPKYTVTYNSNLATATGGQTDTNSPYYAGSTVMVLDKGTMAAEGYTFLGWNTDQTAATNGTVQYAPGATFTINNNTTLYAVWQEIPKYNVTYNKNLDAATGTVTDTSSPYYTGTQVTVMPNDPDAGFKADGYKFLGWSLNQNATEPDSNYTPGNTFNITSDMVFYAVWVPVYEVTYNKNLDAATGDVPVDMHNPYDSGSTVTVLDQGGLTATNYIFKGWNTDQTAASNGTVQYTAGDSFTITADTTLYGVWEPKLNVTYIANISLSSGSVPVDDQSPYEKDSTVTVLGQGNMEPSGNYIFKGWNTNQEAASNGTVQYTAGDSFTITADTTLYGVWEPKVTVTYHENISLSSGSVPVDDQSPYEKGSTVTVLGQGSMVPNGDYVFLGWNTNQEDASNGAVQYSAGATFTITSDTHLYGVWEPKVTVTYHENINLDSGSAPVDLQSPYENGDTVTVLGQGSMVPSGNYVFKGWNTNQTAATNGTVQYAAGAKFIITENTDLYGVWEQVYTVTYDKNLTAATGEQTDPQSPYAWESNVTVLDQGSMAATGYVFKGWNTDQDAATNGTVQYNAGDTFAITGDVTLYAVWKPTVTVTYHANIQLESGSAPVDSNSPYEKDSTVTILGQGNMVPDGNYLFKGWNTDATQASNGVVEYSVGDTFGITSDTDLHGVWVPQYTVTYHKTLEAATGSQTDDDSPYESGKTVTILDQGSMEADGYIFRGWNTDPTAATNGTVEYIAGDTFEITQDTTLYAVWEPKLKVTYYANIDLESGSAPVDSQSPYENGSDVTVLGQGNMVPETTDFDYEFRGWNTDQTAAKNGTVQYTVGQTFNITADTDLYAVWVPKYNVTYDKNIEAAEGSQVDNSNPYDGGSTVTVLDQGSMKADGFTFKGWNTDQTAATNGTVQYNAGATFTINQNTVLYAVWEPKVNVTYHENITLTKGSVPVDANSPYEVGKEVTVLDEGTMVVRGHTFLGWNTSQTEASSGIVQYGAGDTFDITEDTNLYAVWQEQPQYTVTYDKNLTAATGEQTDTNSPYYVNELVTVLGQGEIEAEGYTFKGWNTDADAATAGTVEYLAGATFTITQNTILYAVWEEIPQYSVTYNKNLDAATGTLTDSNSPYYSGTEVTVLHNNGFTAVGYKFLGWSQDENATTPDENYDPGDKFTITANTVFYAVWEPVYTVTYDKNLEAATGSQTDKQGPYTSGSEVTVLDQGDMAAEGYTFEGWNTDKDSATAGTVEYTANDTFDISGNTTLYAVWKEIPKYKVVYEKNLEAATGTLTDANSPYYSGTEVTVLSNTGFTAVDYKFLGWSKDQNATAPDENYDPGDKFTITEDTIFYAVWQPLYRVTYDKNLEAATGSQTDKQGPYTSGNEVTVLDQGTMAAEGYAFKGWNTVAAAATAGTVEYAAGDTFTITKNTTLYAVWETIPQYSVTYNKNLATATGSVTDANSPYYSGTEVTVLANDPDTGFKADGYKFLGWSRNANATTPDTDCDPGDKFTITGNTEFYAVWTPLYTVTYKPNIELTSGSAPTDTQSPYEKDSEVTVLGDNGMTVTGLVFNGWNTDSTAAYAGTVEYAPGATFTITADTILYGVWSTTPKYMVTYDKNLTTATGSQTDDKSPYDSGKTVTVLDQGTMAADGYTFQGWNSDATAAANGTVEYAAGATFTITKNTTLYAVWKELPKYSVTYDKNLEAATGSMTDPKSPYYSGKEVTVLANESNNGFKAEGYNFLGWSLDSQATTPDSDYDPGDKFTITGNTTLYAVWGAIPKYTVTYHGTLTSATNVPTDAQSPYFAGTGVEVLDAGSMKADGYTFQGWNPDETEAKAGVADPLYAPGVVFEINDNVELYAVWAKIPTYTVTYVKNLDAASAAPTDSNSPYLTDSTVTVLGAGTMKATGYAFVGWSQDKDATSADANYAPGKTFAITQNETFYAVWVPTYTVTYVANIELTKGAAPTDSNEYKEGEFATAKDQGTMEATGYTFLGWNKDKNATTADYHYDPDAEFQVTENTTLYAVWEKVPTYTVTYVKNLDAASAAPIDSNSPYTSGSTVTVLGAGDMKADGYVFSGWGLVEDAPNSEDAYAPGKTFTIAQDVILYAVWVPTHTVTYVANIELTSGSAPIDSNEYRTGVFTTAKDQGSMEATGYTFLGWSEDPNATEGDYHYEPKSEFQVTKDIKLYAVWEKVPTYTVTYVKNLDAASAAPTDSNSPYTTGSTVTVLGAGDMKATNYAFVGWSQDKDATSADANYAPGKTFAITQNETFYAVWVPTYTVTYVANIELTKGAAPTDSNEYKEGEFATAKDQGTMEATGYTFLGWNKDKNATTADYHYDPDAEFQVTENTTLYAVWEKVPTYTVTYVKNLDAASDAPKDSNGYTTDSTVTVLGAGDMKADGYVFVGWSRYANETSPDENLAPGKTFTITQDEVFYAVWLPTFTVTYVANIELTKGAAPTDTNEYKEGEFATAKTQGTMEATGYTFLGWSEDKNATTADYNYDPDAEFQVLKDTTLYAVWEKVPTYTVTYVKNLDAASDAPVDGNSPYTTGSTVTILDQGEMKADGYQFMGWKPDLGSTGANPDCAPGKTFTINQDVTLYAVWVPTRTLTYDANGGENAPVDSKSPYLDGTIVTVAEQGNMTKGTDVFKGWSKDSNATEADDTFIPGGDYQLTEDTTLYAVWAPTYEATFDPNGGTNSPDAERRYEAGDVVTIPEGTPEKTGGRFDGWTLDPNDPDAPLYHAGDGVLMTEGGITLTAVWTDVYSVVYDPNGGANEPKDEKKYATGEQVAVPTGTPTKEGFEFKGWSLDPTDPDAPLYHAGDTVTMEGKDITFSAVWSKINDQPILIYHVTYDPAGGVPTPADTTEYVDGATVIITSDIPVRDGYTFGGWTLDPTDPSAPVLKGGNTTTIPGNDLTFTAIWIPNYVVIYDKNAEDATGSQKDTNNPYESGETVTVLGAGSITREGFIFKGWTKDPAVDVAAFVAGDTFAISEDTTLYAVWEALPTYKVVYDPNGGSNEPTDTTQYKDGETVTVSDTEPVKNGFIFEGWTLDPSTATPVILKGGQTTTVNGGDITLTAVWKADPNVQIVVIFKVTYDPQGGTPTPVDTTEYVDGGTVIVTNDVPVKDGFVLDGWTLDPNAATPVILAGGQTTKISGSDLTFYAVWAPVYTVDYNADGAASTPKDEKKYRNGEKAVILKDIPQAEGKVFKGWTLDPKDTTNLLQNGDTVTVEGKNIVLYAVFETISSSTFTVKYDLNGGQGTAPSDTNAYERDSSVIIVKDVPKRDGYTFTGWSTKLDGSTRYKGGDSFTITTDITFYAQWTPNDTAVKTGDPMQMVPWMLMALLSMAGVSAALIRGKRKEK